jgi:hypothetical protein
LHNEFQNLIYGKHLINLLNKTHHVQEKNPLNNSPVVKSTGSWGTAGPVLLRTEKKSLPFSINAADVWTTGKESLNAKEEVKHNG